MVANNLIDVEQGDRVRVSYNSVYSEDGETGSFVGEVLEHVTWGHSQESAVTVHELRIRAEASQHSRELNEGESDRRVEFFVEDGGVWDHPEVQAKNGARWHQINVAADRQVTVEQLEAESQAVEDHLAGYSGAVQDEALEMLRERTMANASNPDTKQIRRPDGTPGPSLEKVSEPRISGGTVYVLTEDDEQIELGQLDLLSQPEVADQIDELAEQTYLSEREAQVQVLKELGLSHGDVAQQLDVAQSSVDEYSRRASQKAEKARQTLSAVSGL